MKIFSTVLLKVNKGTNNLFQRHNVGLHTRGSIFVKRFLERSKPSELDNQPHGHENVAFERYASLPGTSLIISDDIVQRLIDIFDFTNLEKLGNATQSIRGFETGFVIIPATVARTERVGM